MVDFFPMIQCGVMSHEMFCAALEHHHEFNMNMLGVSIHGLAPATEPYYFPDGSSKTILELLDEVTDGAPYFMSIEPTKLSEEEGHYILLMTKAKVHHAGCALDCFIDGMHHTGTHNALAFPDMRISHINCPHSQLMTTYADSLATKLTPVNEVTIHQNTANAWSHVPSYKLDEENDFPDLPGTNS